MMYNLYGLVLRTDIPFRNRLIVATSNEHADVTFTVADAVVDIPDGLVGRHFESHGRHRDGSPVFYIDEYSDRSILAFPHLVRYHLVGGTEVIVERLGDVSDELIEIHLLGLVSSFILERKGVLAMHASAVVRPGGAIAFLAFNKGGKTSLAAAFVQAGDALLTDDILAVRSSADTCIGAPGYPQMRMWPEQALALTGHCDTYERVLPTVSKRLIPLEAVGPGGFYEEPVPISAIFVPERIDAPQAPIEIERMPPSDAFRVMLANGFIAEIAEASGMLRSRFAAITQLLGVTPVYTLRYPSGVQHLPAVREAILKRLE
jgi:hypothetical protein